MPKPTRYRETGMINLLRMTAKMSVQNFDNNDNIPRENNARAMNVSNYQSKAQDFNETRSFLLSAGNAPVDKSKAD